MFKRRYALLGLLVWKLGKRQARRKLHLTRRHSSRTLPLIAGGIVAAGLAAAVWRIARSDEGSAGAHA